jgi:hypothetical protein
MKNIVIIKNDVWNELINEGLALKVKPKIK